MSPDTISSEGERIPAAKFIKRISNCYLRRVYNNDQSGEVIAAWMCAEGPSKSRVVLGSLARTKEDRVLVQVMREQRNNVSAPERQGSAFAK